MTAADEPIGKSALRSGEATAPLPEGVDAHLHFIGRIATPWRTLKDCPKHGDLDNGPDCCIEIDPRWSAALTGIEKQPFLQVLYWMDRSRRDLTLQNPHGKGTVIGSFALRSPLRPNPIASSVVRLIAVEGTTLTVRGLDCLDGTPLLDIKPERCPPGTAAGR